MVKEAYCSFEISKLLKERGFDEPCLKNYWDSDKELHNWSWSLEFHTNKERNLNTKDCAAPTHQMAMAWLREVHNILIQIWILSDYGYWFNIEKLSDNYNHKELYSIGLEDKYYSTYEEATEAALKYCLEKIIK